MTDLHYLAGASGRASTPLSVSIWIILLTSFIVIMAAGCAPVIWDRPMTTQTDFDMDKARCQLTAKAVTPDVGPSRPHYTLASSAGAGIADGIMLGIERAENFKLCMQANGYQMRMQ